MFERVAQQLGEGEADKGHGLGPHPYRPQVGAERHAGGALRRPALCITEHAQVARQVSYVAALGGEQVGAQHAQRRPVATDSSTHIRSIARHRWAMLVDRKRAEEAGVVGQHPAYLVYAQRAARSLPR